MNRNYSFKRILLLSSVLCTPYAHGQPASVTLGEAAQAGTLVIDRLTGYGYVATAANAGTGVDNIYALTPGSYAVGGTITATGIASTPAQDATIRLMKLFHYGTTNAPYLAFTSSTNNIMMYLQDATTGGTYSVTAAALKDSTGTLLVGSTSIRALAASSTQTTVFAAVAASASANWASAGRGISVLPLTGTTPAYGTPGTAVGVIATAQGTGQSFGVVGTSTLTANSDPVLYYDDVLSCLYVGGQAATAANAGNIALSVLCYQYANPTLTVASTVGNVAALGVDDIISITSAGAAEYACAYNLGVMHTSTGFAYLIVNGGTGATAPSNAFTYANNVYALPLVTGSSTAALNGTFAYDNLSSPDFTVQATTSKPLPTNTSAEAMVGGGALPFLDTNNVLTTMQVSGDCVYIGINYASDANDEAGVFYSTPEFNQYGKIIRWSRWTRAVPAELGSSATDGNVQNFVVDGSTGRVWTVDGGTNTIVKVSTLGVGEGTTELATIVNANLGGSCTAIGVFDRTAINFGDNVKGRFALFGSSDGTVVFAMTSLANSAPGGVYDEPETPIDAYNNAANLLVTNLPASANNCVTALGGTNYTTTNEAFYFLAGTPNGLYAYAITANGQGAHLAANQLDALNAGFFANTNSWQLVPGITGNITKIATSATLTGVLASNGSAADTLYMLATPETTVTELGAYAYPIAVAKTGSLAAVNHIYDFKIIYDASTAGTNTYSQIVIATDQGLYQSAITGGIAAATNQATALWSPVGDKPGNTPGGAVYWKLLGKRKIDSETSFVGIRYTNTRDLSEGQSLDQFCCANYNTANNSVNSFGTGGNGISKNPLDYTSNATISGSTFTNPTINIHDYFTDGLRRIAVGNDISDDTYRAVVWPYDITVTTGWNVADPTTIGTSSSTNKMYCCNLISDGHFAVGTDDGIILF